MGAGDNLVGANTRNGSPKDAPFLHFGEADAGCDFALERLGMLLTGEVGIAELLTRAEAFHIPIAGQLLPHIKVELVSAPAVAAPGAVPTVAPAAATAPRPAAPAPVAPARPPAPAPGK